MDDEPEFEDEGKKLFDPTKETLDEFKSGIRDGLDIPRRDDSGESGKSGKSSKSDKLGANNGLNGENDTGVIGGLNRQKKTQLIRMRWRKLVI